MSIALTDSMTLLMIGSKLIGRSTVKGIVFFAPSLCNVVMFANFQADRRSFMANHKVKRAERRCARAAEQVFRKRELMPSGRVAESESRVDRILSTSSGAKDTEYKSS